jgi:hypothetical protein
VHIAASKMSTWELYENLRAGPCECRKPCNREAWRLTLIHHQAFIGTVKSDSANELWGSAVRVVSEKRGYVNARFRGAAVSKAECFVLSDCARVSS